MVADEFWSGILASRSPPSDIDLSAWEHVDIGQDIYNEPLLSVWWHPRLSKIEADSRQAYAKATESAYAAMKYLFNPPAVEYVLYRSDADLWIRTSDAKMAGRLLVAAVSELRQEREKMQERHDRLQQLAEQGITLARFDPRHVFVKRHERRSR